MNTPITSFMVERSIWPVVSSGFFNGAWTYTHRCSAAPRLVRVDRVRDGWTVEQFYMVDGRRAVSLQSALDWLNDGVPT